MARLAASLQPQQGPAGAQQQQQQQQAGAAQLSDAAFLDALLQPRLVFAACVVVLLQRHVASSSGAGAEVLQEALFSWLDSAGLESYALQAGSSTAAEPDSSSSSSSSLSTAQVGGSMRVGRLLLLLSEMRVFSAPGYLGKLVAAGVLSPVTEHPSAAGTRPGLATRLQSHECMTVFMLLFLLLHQVH